MRANPLTQTKKNVAQLNKALEENGDLLKQVISVYKLWKRAMAGEWEIYFKYFAFTIDEHEENEDLRKAKPLINDADDAEWMIPFLSLIFENDYSVLHVVKSRQQRVSWILTHVYLYEGLISNNWLIILQSTKKVNKADELFEKQQKAYNRLPSWKPKLKYNLRDGKSTLTNGTKYTMLGEDTDDSAGFTFNRFYFDEMALHKKASKVVGTCLAGLGIGHGGGRNLRSSSTPRLNSYHTELSIDEFVKDTKTWLIKRDWSQNGLFYGWNKRGHKVISLHYSANPKKDAAWRDREKPNYEPDTWEREYELNPDANEGDAVFKRFEIGMVKNSLPLIETLPLFRGWDFGVKSAVVWSQYDHRHKEYRVLQELLHEYTDAGSLVREVDRMTKKLVKRGFGSFGSYVLDFCDPYSGSKTDYITGSTPMYELEFKMNELCGSMLRFQTAPRIFIVDRIEIARAVISQGFSVHEDCALICKGLKGGYVIKHGTDQPRKDGVYDHLMDALTYTIISLFNINPLRGLMHLSQRVRPMVSQARPSFNVDEDLLGIKIMTSR